MKKKLLITGGAGFIGTNLVNYFLKKQYNITVLDNLSVGNIVLLTDVANSNNTLIDWGSNNTDSTLSFIKGDIRNNVIVEEAVKGKDIIVHLAGETGISGSVKDPDKDAAVNILGTINLLKASVKFGISKFIFASSTAVLGDQIPPNDELKIPKPISPYGASKLAAEGYCFAFNKSFNLNTIILRFPNIYGPFSYHKNSVITQFIKQILNNEEILVYGNGQQTRDFLFVNDMAVIIDKIIEYRTTNAELFQLGTEKETSINDLIANLIKISQSDLRILYKKGKKFEVSRSFTSTKKIRSVLDLTLTTDLYAGLKITWDWFENYFKIINI